MYVQKRGTLNLGMRMEWLMARQALLISSAMGGKSKFKDFIRFHAEDAPEPKEMTGADLARMYGAVKKNG
jgi:hypothetical protein